MSTYNVTFHVLESEIAVFVSKIQVLNDNQLTHLLNLFDVPNSEIHQWISRLIETETARRLFNPITPAP